MGLIIEDRGNTLHMITLILRRRICSSSSSQNLNLEARRRIKKQTRT
jgi:hypothetical protein